MWPAENKYRAIYRAISCSDIQSELRLNFKVQRRPFAIFEKIVRRFQRDAAYERICGLWRGFEGQKGTTGGIREELITAKANNQTTDRFKEIQEKARLIDIHSRFLYRGVSPSYEYGEVEDLTATSLSVEMALKYGDRPFMVIYVPDGKVYGLPIYCSENDAEHFGTNRDVEILLIKPNLTELDAGTDNIKDIKDMLEGPTRIKQLKIYEYHQGHN